MYEIASLKDTSTTFFLLCVIQYQHHKSIYFMYWHDPFPSGEHRKDLVYQGSFHMGLHEGAVYHCVQQPGSILPSRLNVWCWLPCHWQADRQPFWLL